MASRVSMTLTTSSSTSQGSTVEQTPAAAEQYRHLCQLQLVQHTLGERLLRGVAALDVDVPVAGRRLRLLHGAHDAVGVGHVRVAPPGGRTGRAVARNEDRHAAHQLSTPMVHQLRRAPAGHDRAAGAHLVHHLPGGPGDLCELAAGCEPLVQPVAVRAAEEVVLVGDVAVGRDGHEQDARGHRCSSSSWPRPVPVLTTSTKAPGQLRQLVPGPSTFSRGTASAVATNPAPRGDIARTTPRTAPPAEAPRSP